MGKCGNGEWTKAHFLPPARACGSFLSHALSLSRLGRVHVSILDGPQEPFAQAHGHGYRICPNYSTTKNNSGSVLVP